MFTKEDYKEYFETVSIKKRGLVFKLQEVISSLSDENIKTKLSQLAKTEMYGYLHMETVMETILCGKEKNMRTTPREYVLGKIKLKNIDNLLEYDVRCINISSGGLGIEFQEEIPSGSKFTLEGFLYNNLMSISKKGKLMWTKKIENNFFVGGIQFDMSYSTLQ